jgi:hypothetical protein
MVPLRTVRSGDHQSTWYPTSGLCLNQRARSAAEALGTSTMRPKLARGWDGIDVPTIILDGAANLTDTSSPPWRWLAAPPKLGATGWSSRSARKLAGA